MKEFLMQILRATVKGEAGLTMKSKGTACVMKKGKIIYTIKEVEIVMDVPPPR